MDTPLLLRISFTKGYLEALLCGRGANDDRATNMTALAW